MTTKINSNILSEETKRKMIDAISKTILSKTEHGFRLCLNEKDNIIRHGNLCKGRRCSIESGSGECEKDEKFVGFFHTHHKGLIPSISDLHVGYRDEMTCIGSFEGIRCLKRKKEDFDALEYADIRLQENKEMFIKREYDRLTTKEITNQEFKEEYEKYRKEIDRLVNSYFKTIDIKK